MTTFSQTRWSLNDLLDAPDSPRFNDYQAQLIDTIIHVGLLLMY